MRGQPGRHERTESVSCMHGNPIAADDQQHEQHQHHQRAHKPQLLAENGENIVVVFLGKIQIFLPTSAEPEPHESARADGIQRLQNLIAVSRRVGGRVAPRRHTRAGVAHEVEVQHRKHCDDCRADAEPFELRSAEEHHGRPDGQQNQDARKVLFQRNQTADHKQNHRERQNAVAEGLHLLAVGRHERCKSHDDCDLCQLRWLEGGKANPDPALRAALLRTENRNEQQKEYRACQHEKRDASPELIVDARDEQHHADAQHRENRLPRKIIGGVSLFIICSCIAR